MGAHQVRKFTFPLLMANAPTPAEIKAARAHRTQTQAAALVYTSLRTWQSWEWGQALMPLECWELFRLKTGALTVAKITGDENE